MKIAQVNAHDVYGGAEAILQALRRGSTARGHQVEVWVGRKHFNDDHTFEIQHEPYRSNWARTWGQLYLDLANLTTERWRPIYRGVLQEWIGQPLRRLRLEMGHEDFEYPGTVSEILKRGAPDLFHLHNLHGAYFDLRSLESLSHVAPVFLTLHDSWLMTGHCSHPLDCGKWEGGCGGCPYLNIFPKIKRDASAYNLVRKQEIYRRSMLHVATPSHWLMDKLERSKVREMLMTTRVIPNGIDLTLFHPKDQKLSREQLGLPQEVFLLVFAAKNARKNVFKDFETIERALGMLSREGLGRPILLMVLGENGESIRHGNVEIRFVTIEENPWKMAQYYQAADLYLHGAFAENYPTVIMEAMACGTPVIASGVGGILEQIICLDVPERGWDVALHGPRIAGPGQATGLVFEPKNAEALAHGIRRLLISASLRAGLSENALNYARENFGVKTMVDRYHDWYEEILPRVVPIRSGNRRRLQLPEVFLSVGHTARSTQNTGIQRVVRALARQCSENRLIRYVEWKSKREAFYELNPRLCRGLARFGGPSRKPESLLLPSRDREGLFRWSEWKNSWGRRFASPIHRHPDFLPVVPGSWLVIPELMSAEMMKKTVEYGKAMGLKIAVIFHDAIAWDFPEFVSDPIRKNHEGYMRAVATSDRVLAVSEYSAQAFVRFCEEKGLNPPKVSACRLADELLGRARWRQYDPPQEGPVRILCVATLEPRKNHLRLLKAVEGLSKKSGLRDWRLTLVGYPYQGAEEIRSEVERAVKSNARIEWRQHVDDVELEGFYRRSHFTVFPSLVEGFGLPLVESLWNSRPCVCHESGSMGELARDGGCYPVNVENVEALTFALERMIQDESFRKTLAMESIRRRFRTWREYADDVLESLRV